MPVASMARAIKPPRASISATRCPFAVPPMAGLQGMWATVSSESVQIATCRPSRAAAYAASQPAWPAPITITSSRSGISWSLSDAEPREDFVQQVVRRAFARHLFERMTRLGEIGEHEFFRNGPTRCRYGIRRSAHRVARALEQIGVPDVGDGRRFPRHLERIGS